jgi:hypothetical protein
MVKQRRGYRGEQEHEEAELDGGRSNATARRARLDVLSEKLRFLPPFCSGEISSMIPCKSATRLGEAACRDRLLNMKLPAECQRPMSYQYVRLFVYPLITILYSARGCAGNAVTGCAEASELALAEGRMCFITTACMHYYCYSFVPGSISLAPLGP